MDNVRNLGGDIAVAGRIALLRLRGQMQYRMSFWLQVVGNFVVNGVEVLVLWALFQHFESLGGWNLREIVFLHGLAMLMFSIGDTISNGIQTVPGLIRDGDFDRTLIRPMSTYLQALVNEVSLRHFGQFLQGAMLLGIGIALVDIDWSLGKLVYLPIVVASGAALFVALFTIEAIISFWTVGSIEAINAFTYGGSDLGQYPLHVFRSGLRLVFLWVIPIGFMTYFPAVYLLGKDDPLGFPRIAYFMAPVAALIFCLVVNRGWAFALRHYQSTGS